MQSKNIIILIIITLCSSCNNSNQSENTLKELCNLSNCILQYHDMPTVDVEKSIYFMKVIEFREENFK